MRRIKTLIISLIFVFVFMFLLTSCDDKKNPSSYYLNNEGNLIVVYDDGTENNLGKWNETIILSIKDITISDDGYFVIDGVKTNIFATNTYTVSFDTGFSTKINSVKVKDGYKVDRPDISRPGYVLNGWKCNGEEWRFNSDVVKNDMTLTADWTALSYNIKFENSKGINPNDEVYTSGTNVTLPTVEPVEGYTFDGWYNNNTKVSNGEWNIAQDVTLVAKWVANSYTITINPNGGNISSTSATVKYGENYTLPVPTNDFGAFKGWSYNDVQLTDSQGKSLNPYAYDSNITVTTNWIEEISTVEQLKAISIGLNGHYKLIADIDLENEEWTPIGNATTPFTGIFDGNGHSISNLTISNVEKNVGLFGYSTGTIKNVILENVNIDLGTINDDSNIAAVVAINKGELNNIYTSSGVVKIANHSATLTSYVGGITAYNYGSLFNIKNSLNVSGGTYSGGICAYDESKTAKLGQKLINNGSIEGLQTAGGVYGYSKRTIYSYMKNTGNVTATNNAGGIVGDNTSSITFEYCVNTGNISSTDNKHGTSYAGGLSSNASHVVVSDSYNTGLIYGYSKGGLVGYNIGSGTYTRCLNTASCSHGFSNYMGSGSTIYDSMDYGTSSFASGYATVTNSYHEKPSSNSFYIDTLFWSNEIWDFSGTNNPVLKWESE